MSRQAVLIGAGMIAALTSLQAQAQDPITIFWQGGTGTLLDGNYSDGTNTGLTPQPTDWVNFGNDGIATFNGTAGIGRLRVGHNQTTPGGVGAGTVTLTSGTFLELTGGEAGINNAALWVGQARNGVLNIEQGAFLSVSRLIGIGVGGNQNFSGTVNVTTGGILSVANGNINMGDATTPAGNGVPGHLNISDSTSSITIAGNNADLTMSPRSAVTTYTQTDGTVSINDAINVTTPESQSTGTTFNISGGTLTTGTGTGANFGNVFVGRGASVNATFNISGTATVNVGNRFLLGGSVDAALPAGSAATGIVTNHSGGTLNVDLDIRVADAAPSATSDATYNLSGTGVINTNVSAGTIGSTVVGRQGVGRFFQTGGTANFNSPLVVGSRETATAVTANGLYEISAGELNVNAVAPTFARALEIAPNGTGEFRVLGDDATIDVTGDFAISSTENGNGTLAFELVAGDLLSQINVTGIATFNAGAIVALDTSNAAPSQTIYDLLTATDIIDSGIDFNGPAGWGIEIVPGGNGEILRLVEGIAPVLTGDYNEDGSVDAADYVVWRRTGINEQQGYDDWRANFGATSPGAGSSDGNAVPEPGAWTLVIIGMTVIAGWRSRALITY